MDSARRLIAEKRYNEALLVLTNVMRNEPDKIEEAEGLIRLVRSYQGIYNDRYEELISVLSADRDVGKALELIRELETLDPNPSPETAAALTKARASASFLFEQQEFTRIMDEALALLEEGRFWEAAALYESSLGVGRERFTAAQYGNIAENRVSAVLASVRQEVSAFRGAEARQREAMTRLREAAASPERAAFQEAASRFFAEYRPVARMVVNMLGAASALREQNAAVLPDKEDIFLGYMSRLVGGRQNSGVSEGFKGTAERLLDAASRPAIEILLDRAQARLEEGRASLVAAGAARAPAAGAFAEAGSLADEAARLFSLWHEALPFQGAVMNAEGWKIARGEVPLYLRLHTVRAAAAGYSRLTVYTESIGAASRMTRNSLEELRDYRAGLARLSGSVGELQTAWRQFSGAAGENPLAADGTRALSQTYRGDLAAWQERISARELEAAERMAAIQLAPFADGLVSAGADYATGQSYMNGVARERENIPGVKETVTAYYPSEALALFTGLSARLRTLETAAQAFLAEYADEETRLTSQPGVALALTEVENNLAEIQRLRALLVPAAQAAQARALQAERYKNEGNLRLTEVQAAINAQNFEAGKSALVAARQSFSNSLALEDNEALSRDSDARLLSFDTALREAENRKVIAEVRSLTDQGRRLYDEGRYIEAENTLSRAQRRWETTQTTEEPVIAYWLGFVRTALFVGASREIRLTDPLYNEMTQLLNLAREDYTRAQTFTTNGNRQEALSRLASADMKIAQVKRAFPNNQAAGVLTLRIAFLRGNEGDASVMFRNMFNAAVGKNDGTNSPQTLEAYTELQDLRQINPNYPGIAKAIYDAEIALRIRRPPPDPRAVAESSRLTREAGIIVQRRETLQYPLAMDMVTRALVLDPDNRQALEIRLRLSEDSGGTVRNILPRTLQDQFIRAQQLFAGQNYFESLAIVERLLQTPEGRDYPPLQDLKRRIESLI